MHRFACVLLLAAFAGCARADIEVEKTALMTSDREWSQTTNDLDKFMTYFASDATSYPPGAPAVTGTEGIRKTMGQIVGAPGISLSWTASTDNTSQVWHTLLVDGTPLFADQIEYSSATVLYLAPGTTHVFQLTARDRYGNTVESNALSVTTPTTTDTVAPTAPTNFRFSSETNPPEAWLNWDQSTDETDPQSQILYEVFVNGVRAGEFTTIGYASALAYCREPGLPSFVVRATDTSGNVSPPSNEIFLNC